MYYAIKITKEAKTDLKFIKSYLENNLRDKRIANNLMKKIRNNIQSLSYFPLRYPVIKSNFFSERKIRKFTVNNYLIFYTIDELKNIVHIIRIIYAKSNWLKKL